MLRKKALKKIFITTLSLLLVSIIYLFPENKNVKISNNVSYQKIDKRAIYLPNNEEYISRIMVIKNNNKTIDAVKEIINYLTIGSNYNDYLPNFIKPIIPKNTNLLNISLDNGLLKINFSKNFLNVKKSNENKLIESLVYSLLEIKEIKNIMIFVEGEKLTILPKSNIKLPPTLDKSIGINKIYDISDYHNINEVTTYYIAKNNDNYYYIPITKVANFSDDKIKIIISELKSSLIYQTNLMSFLKANVELEDYEILENKIKLSFNNYIFDDFNNKNILEETKYSISLSVRDTYNIDTVVFNVNKKDIIEFNV